MDMHNDGNMSKTQRSGTRDARPTIGFIISDVTTPVNTQIWSGAVAAARELGVNLIGFNGYELQRPDEFKAQGNILYELICADNVAGLVLYSSTLGNYVESDAVRRLYEGFPDVPMVEFRIPTTLADNYGYRGTCAMLRHLLDTHACRQIAFIRGPASNPEAEARYQAYRETLHAAGLPVDPQRVVQADGWFEPSGKNAMEILLDQRHVACDAVAAANDCLAMGAIQALQERGLRVPHDVAVTGFDDLSVAQYCLPSLTTVRQPMYEMSWQAVEAVTAAIAGQEFVRSPFPVQLQVRHSCGCVSPAVVQAASVDSAVTMESFEHAIAACRTALLEAFQPITQETGLPLAQIERLFEAFAAEMRGEETEPFISVLHDILMQTIMAGKDVAVWHAGMSVLSRHIRPCLPDRRTMGQAEAIWQQARIVIGEMTTQARMAEAAEKRRKVDQLLKLESRLGMAFNVEQLMNILVGELPTLDIPSCYLALYEDPQMPTDTARLVLAYTDQGCAAMDPKGHLFPAKYLVPAQFLPQDRQYAFLLQDLYFHDQQIGFVLFEVSPQWRNVYETLCGAISSALQGALLVQRVQERSAELARQQYILDTFLANIPDSIYFKDRESRIIRSNQAHATSFGLTDPGELVGKSDFDFFPDATARPKYEQEQDIIRTGQPLLNLEEPDAGGRWALTTKMPLQDEHGDIIGTFGISRDITELKKAQQALTQAYSEISVLNVQLQQDNVRMSAELNVVKQLQQMILPRPEELQDIPGLDIVGYMQPADEVGGDYYDVLHDNGLLHIGIGDVTGHGLESGVMMLMTQAAIRTLIEHGETDPVKFVNTLNHLIYKNAQRIGTDKNLTFALIQYQAGQFKLVGQHEDVLVVRQGGQVERIDTMDLGFPVGLEPEIQDWVHTATITLNPGDGLVLYTDGIPEAENTAQQQYGLDRLCAVIGQHWNQSTEAIKQAVVDDVMAHIGAQKVYDDITLVVLKQQ